MIDEGLMLISVRHLVGPILCHKLLFKISVALTTLKHFLLWCLLFDLQTSVRGQNGVEFYQESTGHIGFFIALLLAEIASERLKILTSLLFDLQTSARGQNGVEFCQKYLETHGTSPTQVNTWFMHDSVTSYPLKLGEILHL